MARTIAEVRFLEAVPVKLGLMEHTASAAQLKLAITEDATGVRLGDVLVPWANVRSVIYAAEPKAGGKPIG